MNELMDIARQTLKRKKSAVEQVIEQAAEANSNGTSLRCEGPGPTQELNASSLPGFNWLQQWRDLAQMAGTLSAEDPRYDPILVALAACQCAYKAGDRERFTAEAEHVKRIAAFAPGSVIQWRGHDKKLQGPATVTEVIYEDGRLWVCVKWKGQLYWVSESIIENITAEGRLLQNRAATED